MTDTLDHPPADHTADHPAVDRAVTARADEGSVAIAHIASVTSIVFFGAIFGFFYAWVCSTMWGLDAADPRVAIEAMQEMNGSVRNAVFAPAFFATPFVGLGTAVIWRRAGDRRAATWFAAASAVYLVGGLLLTMAINVPMNEDLAEVVIPTDRAAAEAIWNDYSGDWQIWNVTRTVCSGIALVLVGVGTLHPRRPVAAD